MIYHGSNLLLFSLSELIVGSKDEDDEEEDEDEKKE